MELTSKAIDSQKPRKSRYEVSFEGYTRLRLRISPSGAKTFYYQYRVADARRFIRIAEYRPRGFDDIQKQALIAKLDEYQTARENNRDPGVLYRDEQEVLRKNARKDKRAKQKQSQTLNALAREYFNYLEKAKRSWREDRRMIHKDILPTLGATKLKDIAVEDVSRELKRVKRRGNVVANRTQAALTTMLNWAVSEGKIQFNPLSGSKKIGGKEESRERDLSPAEIRVFWHGINNLPLIHSTVLRLLLFTGARRGEISQARWRDVDFQQKTLTVPKTRTKTGKVFVIPLSGQARELLKELKKKTGMTPYLFPQASGEKPIPVHSVSHALLDARRNGLFGDIEDFTVHDLRRTYRTLVNLLGVDRDIVERTLGHQVGTRVERAYDRYSYLNEKREVLQKWANYLDAVISETADVITI